MDRKTVLEKISGTAILPVIKIDKLEHSIPLAKALRDGGVNALEITVRNDIAFDAIKKIKSVYPDMAVGAGTILSCEQASAAMDIGTDFIVSPGFDRQVVELCLNAGEMVIPGCITPTEIGLAKSIGLDTVKFFPAEKSGGIEAIKLLSGPFKNMKFIPTGGIDFTNLGSYLQSDFVLACGGSFMARADVIDKENWEEITKACQKAINISLGFELAHVGINEPCEEQAISDAGELDALLNLGVRNGSSSVFCGKAVEFMKTLYLGEKGHIGFYTNSVSRAMSWFSCRGIGIRKEIIKQDAANKLVSFYLEREIGGFAVHVVRR